MTPPLGLYVHFPWCTAKCPYCDFNSHALRSDLPETGYVDALLLDLESELECSGTRPINTVFFGGGTPSLISPHEIGRLIERLQRRGRLDERAEITLEANPGSVESARFAGYRAIGINRLSIGVQSFDDRSLQAIGRIHDGREAARAVAIARSAGFERINIDLMYGLPGQTASQALSDVQTAIELDPGHISHYQLTLEPGTVFYKSPPSLPDQDATADMLAECAAAFGAAGYRRYEVSALARPGHRARHNLNYWLFGDYIGIGAGAHGKLSVDGRIVRSSRPRPPSQYMSQAGSGDWIRRVVDGEGAGFEFMLNALRLPGGFPRGLFEQRTGQPLSSIAAALRTSVGKGLLSVEPDWIRPTRLGQRFLSDLQELFLPPAAPAPPGRGLTGGGGSRKPAPSSRLLRRRDPPRGEDGDAHTTADARD